MLAPNVLSMAAPKAATTLAPVAQSLAQQQPGPMQPVRSPYNSPMPAPKPNALGGAFKSFAQGFLGPEKIGALDKMQSDKQAEVGKRALAWIQQTAQLPPQARAQFTLQNAQRIAADTGQPVEAVMQSAQDPNAFSDEAMQQAIAQFSAQLGQGPEQPEYMNLGGGNVGKVAGGKFSMAHEAPPDPAKAAPIVKPDIKEGGNGNYWERDPGTGAWKDTGVKAPAKSNSNGINLQFGEGGALSGLSIGGTGTKGNEPAIIRGPDNKPVVSPGKQQLDANKDWKSLQDFNAQNGLVLEEIGRALAAVKPSSTGAMAATADIPIIGPSTDAGRLKNLVGTIKANVGFDKLQSMRENSPTGGALGQVAVQEINFLQSVFGSLETAQREEDVRYNLQRLAKFLEGRSERLRNAFAQDYPELAQYAGFAKSAIAEGNQLQKMSDEDLRKRLAQLKGGQ